MKDYDAIIIGSGQGGNPLAHKLADLGRSVALVEREHLGGSCVNYGCTPTKTMIASARAAHAARTAEELGVDTGDVRIDLPTVVDRKNEMIKRWREGQEEQVSTRPSLDLYRSHGRFTGPRTVTVDEDVLQSDHIIVDTGTRARIPDVAGIEDVPYLTNRTVMELRAVPDHLVILGGGYIGLEFGQMYRRFGSEVTVIDHNERIIPREDPEVSEALQDALEAEGMRFQLGCTIESATTQSDTAQSASARDGNVELDVTDGSTLSGSHLLVAAGRVPNTDDLGLEAAGIETDELGFIDVNDRLETNVDGIWAIGDVKGGPAFTHISYDDHFVVFDNMVHGKDRSISGRIVPYALFTDPELGRVGMTESQAQEAGHRILVGSVPMSRVARAIERGKTAGLMKVVIDADTDRILGASILGSEGGELVQTLMTLMLADAPWTVLKEAVYIHPTMAEGFFALFESVEPVDSDA